MGGGHVLELLAADWLIEPCCVRYNLAYLPSGNIGITPEVRQIVGANAWLSCSATWVAIDVAAVLKAPDEGEEAVGSGHILELLAAGWLIEACGISHDLR